MPSCEGARQQLNGEPRIDVERVEVDVGDVDVACQRLGDDLFGQRVALVSADVQTHAGEHGGGVHGAGIAASAFLLTHDAHAFAVLAQLGVATLLVGQQVFVLKDVTQQLEAQLTGTFHGINVRWRSGRRQARLGTPCGCVRERGTLPSTTILASGTLVTGGGTGVATATATTRSVRTLSDPSEAARAILSSTFDREKTTA